MNPPMSSDRTNRVIHALPWVSLALLLLVLGASGRILRSQDNAQAGIDATKNAGKVTACRGDFRADVDQAQLDKDDAESRRSDAFSDIFTASIAKDHAGVLKASVRLSQAKLDVAEARRKVKAAVDANRAASKLSGVDPAKFLRECAARG